MEFSTKLEPSIRSRGFEQAQKKNNNKTIFQSFHANISRGKRMIKLHAFWASIVSCKIYAYFVCLSAIKLII